MIKAKFVHVDEDGCKLHTLGYFKLETIPRIGEHILCDPGIKDRPLAYQVTDVIHEFKPKTRLFVLMISILNEHRIPSGVDR